MLYNKKFCSKSLFTEFGKIDVDEDGYVDGLTSAEEERLIKVGGFSRVSSKPKKATGSPKSSSKAPESKEAVVTNAKKDVPKQAPKQTRKRRASTKSIAK
ncbi:hypothetical protein [Lactobacillus phage Lbab1]|nr:hypothetical protein [Lactobacillus phage Lbab1]